MVESTNLFKQQGITYILTDIGIININNITHVDLRNIEQGKALVTSSAGDTICVSGIAALELIWMLKPSALEGKRLSWTKNAWIVHNLIAHPIMQICALFGLYKWAILIHDRTVPLPIGIK